MMPWLRCILLIGVALAASGYRFRCYWMCTDQTAIQNDYIEQRDRCREYAQLKLDMSLRNMKGPIEDKTRKSQLVTLFSDCMGNNGWNIPAGDSKPAAAAATAAAPTAAPAAGLAAAAQPVPDAYDEKASLSRSAECAFARHAAANSSISAARAQACDLECAQRLQSAPEAPRPAACPSDIQPDLAKGVERE